MDIKKIATLYGLSVVVTFMMTAAAIVLPSIRQFLLAIASLKWGVVFLLCYVVMHQRKGYALLFVCILVEFATGLLGVFADFKSVFFVLVIAVTSSPLALRGRRLVATLTCFVVLFVLGVVWTSVKTDYRAFLSEEASGPEDVIPIERRFDKLADLIEGVTWENLTDGLDGLILRVSYVNFFALTVENVPSRVPYENGGLWKGSIIHILTPRVFFPDKPVLDDSERTRLYTGVNVAGMESSTSIGIGYVGESYVDFGPLWMFVPIFLLGVLYGVIDRIWVTKTRFKLLGSSFAVAILVFNACAIETSNIKLLGGVVAVALISVVVYKTLASSIRVFLQPPSRPAGVPWLLAANSKSKAGSA